MLENPLFNDRKKTTSMKAHILKIVTDRLKELEIEYFMSLVVMKTFAPENPLPLLNMEAMEKNISEYLAAMNISFEKDSYMTIKEAMALLNVSRNTLFLLRKKGVLTSYFRQGSIYLLRKEVEELRKTYSRKKGKT